MDESVSVQLGRRRTGSQRCESLGDHDRRSDPLDKPRPAAVIEVRAIGRYTVEFLGMDGAVLDALRTLDCKRLRRGGGWHVPQSVADDVMAALEHRGYRLEIRL